MKKKTLIYCLLGFPIGVCINQILSLLISALVSGGTQYYPVTPSLQAAAGGVLAGVLLQFIFSGLLGAASVGLTVIFQMERWSIAKQTFLHFLGLGLVFFPISFLAGWMPPSTTGVLLFIGIFILVYLTMWLAQYLYWRQALRRLNQSLPQ